MSELEAVLIQPGVLIDLTTPIRRGAERPDSDPKRRENPGVRPGEGSRGHPSINDLTALTAILTRNEKMTP